MNIQLLPDICTICFALFLYRGTFEPFPFVLMPQTVLQEVNREFSDDIQPHIRFSPIWLEDFYSH